MSDNPKEIMGLLAEPFDPAEVKAKPATVSGNRALAIFYVDARVIQDRLDDVLGVEGWQDDYEVIPGGSVVCRLRCRISGDWLTKVDVGSPSEQPDAGDKMKAAFSDALKRAAVKFGLGRYLYRTAPLWCDYDPQKRQFVRPPTLPGQKGAAATPPAAAPAPAPTINLAAPLVEDEKLLDRVRKALAKADKVEDAAALWVSGGERAHLAQLTVGEGMRILASLEPKGKKVG